MIRIKSARLTQTINILINFNKPIIKQFNTLFAAEIYNFRIKKKTNKSYKNIIYINNPQWAGQLVQQLAMIWAQFKQMKPQPF